MLLIGVDRLDYTKGLIQRMEAFDLFFSNCPDWRGKVTYLQITPKSRSEIPEYHELEQALGAVAGRVNGRFGEASWTPIRYVNRAHSRSALAGLYRSARAGVVTPLRDGMNLVAKEYVAAQDANDPGVLILSRFAGAAAECQDALLVNPYDLEFVANAIARALEMPLSERRERHSHILATLSQNSSDVWGAQFLQSLEQLEVPGSDYATKAACRSIPILPSAPGYRGSRHSRASSPCRRYDNALHRHRLLARSQIRAGAPRLMLEQNGGWDTKIDAVLKFIAGMRSFYLATASKDGQPYVQHRGGPPGVLRVIMAISLPPIG